MPRVASALLLCLESLFVENLRLALHPPPSTFPLSWESLTSDGGHVGEKTHDVNKQLQPYVQQNGFYSSANYVIQNLVDILSFNKSIQ